MRGLVVVVSGLAAAGMVWLLAAFVRGLTVELLRHPDRIFVVPTYAVSGIVLWWGGVVATTWAAIRVWSVEARALLRPALLLPAALAAVVFGLALLNASFSFPTRSVVTAPGTPPPPSPPGLIPSLLLAALLLAVLVVVPLWAAVDVSRRSPETVPGRRRWLLALVVTMVLGLGWVVALAYAVVVRTSSTQESAPT